jgi:hypothetical protein
VKIVINHLTRMQKGFICVAGIDLATGQHVRPVLRSLLRKNLLARYGGPFDIGRLVDLGWTRYIGTRPETEDYLFHQSEARSIGDMPADEFWAWLSRLAKPKFGEIFGSDLQPRGPCSYAVDLGRGMASLGCYVAAGPLRLFLQQRDARSRGRARMEFRSGEHQFQLSVTDIRLYRDDHVTPDPDVIERVGRQLAAGSDVILGVGLTRAFRGQPDEPALHWLQVNNIHCAHEPCWRLG